MISTIFILISSILFLGITNKVKAIIAGRKMPSIFQPLFDVIRLFKKGAIYSDTTTFIFKIAPIVYFATVLTAVFMIPMGSQKGLLSFNGDFIFFAYILSLGKFILIISAMDTGSSFEGMGANREALYSMLIEPAFFIIIGSLSLFTDNCSFYNIYQNINISSNLSYVIDVSAIYVLIYIAMIENSRLPLDDSKTHLELTMIHEVMVLDNSGFDLALIQISSWLKFAIYGTLIGNFIISSTWHIAVQIVAFMGIQVAFAITVGCLEMFRARNKMDKNPQWLITLTAIAIVTFLTALIVSHKLILN